MNGWLRRILMLPDQASTLAKQIDYLHYSVIRAKDVQVAFRRRRPETAGER